ncbi:MAG: hypothetical protein GY797_06300 [Deltaproteobacteria bacterium]|nr:hypothetical protein [Deltaproteobacteria bacterium]
MDRETLTQDRVWEEPTDGYCHQQRARSIHPEAVSLQASNSRTIALLGIGLAGLAVAEAMRRRKRKAVVRLFFERN